MSQSGYSPRTIVKVGPEEASRPAFHRSFSVAAAWLWVEVAKVPAWVSQARQAD